MNVEYMPAADRFRHGSGYISPDNGQGMVHADGCNNGACQRWDDGEAIVPRLVRNAQGFWCCPVCHGSYGMQGGAP